MTTKFDYKQFKYDAMMQCSPKIRSYGFDPMLIMTILQIVAPLLSNCLNKVNPSEAAKAIKNGNTNAQLALTRAVKEALKKRGEKSTPEQREGVRGSVSEFLKGQPDETIVAMCEHAQNSPNFSDLAL